MENTFLQIIIESLEKQLNQRLEKLWGVFSWTSGILVSISGGVIALQKIKGISFNVPEQVLISVVIVIFT